MFLSDPISQIKSERRYPFLFEIGYPFVILLAFFLRSLLQHGFISRLFEYHYSVSCVDLSSIISFGRHCHQNCVKSRFESKAISTKVELLQYEPLIGRADVHRLRNLSMNDADDELPDITSLFSSLSAS